MLRWFIQDAGCWMGGLDFLTIFLEYTLTAFTHKLFILSSVSSYRGTSFKVISSMKEELAFAVHPMYV